MAAAKLKQYKALRQMCLNQIDELKIFADRAAANPDDFFVEMQFKMLYKRLSAVQRDFKGHHTNILTTIATQENADFDDEETVRRDFEYNCAHVQALYFSLYENVTAVTPPPPQVASPPQARPAKCNAKLPKIEISKFSGDIKAFRPFLDLYKALIHENPDISNIEKFNYLSSFLEGPALALVQCTPMSAQNYVTAYESLIERYDNPRLIALAHLKAIDEAPTLNSSNKTLNNVRSLIDAFNENIAALKNLGFPTDDWDFLFFYMFSKHLDKETLIKFETDANLSRSTIPTYDALKRFMLKQCKALETVTFSYSAPVTKSQKDTPSNALCKNKKSFFTTSSSHNCVFCKMSHHIFNCAEFNKKSPQERLNYAKSNNWCTNCLSSQHTFKKCSSRSTCRYCHSRHHSLLHFNQTSPVQENKKIATSSAALSTETPVASSSSSPVVPTSEASPLSSLTTNVTNFCGMSSSSSSVLLATALVEVLDSQGTYQKIRLLIDSGSEASYISAKCIKRLNLPRFNTALTIQGLNDMHDYTTLGGTTCSIKPIGKVGPIITVDAFILPKLCPNSPNHFIESTNWTHLSNITLADPKYFVPSSVDMLIGADVFPQILQDGRIAGPPDQPIAINTIYGWVLMGKFTQNPYPTRQMVTSLFSATQSTDLLSLNKTLKSFWELEEIPKVISLSPEDELCETIFATTHVRDSDGRYQVELPFKNSTPSFDAANSFALASRRFYSLEKRLLSQGELHRKYSDIIREYLDSGYLEEIPELDRNSNCFYIPHHCVPKSDKIRIVYNASAKLSDGISLNDTLLVGPKLQHDICSILLNFRLHRIVFTCDIKSMFTQIQVAPQHCDFQRIVWRFSPTEPLKNYRLSRVTFGLACSPYLANKVIIQLAHDEAAKFPLAANILLDCIFVDDIATGHDDLSLAKLMRDQLIGILNSGGFHPHKWRSNSQQFLSDLPSEHAQTSSVDLNPDADLQKILGLHWHSQSDHFSFKVDPSDLPCTKRNILSDIARVFDPLGFLAPVTAFAKCFMQTLWSLGLEWDDHPPLHIQNLWETYKIELPLLEKLKIPRHINLSVAQHYQLHGFCDASIRAYACVLYARATYPDGSVQTFFITAKSKVAPLKQVSLPRLELSAAVLLADLVTFVLKTFHDKITFSGIYAWSDSSIALSWIKSPSHRWKTFVANRVSHIQDRVHPECWHHVDSKSNPSDPASRGQLPSAFLQNTSWWAGPAWLCKPEDSWPNKFFYPDDTPEIVCEQKKLALATQVTDHWLDVILNNHSSWPKIQRIICYALRFVHNTKSPEPRHSDNFSRQEFDTATLLVINHIQQTHFGDVIHDLNRHKPPLRLFRKLNVFLDEHNTLRVGGRLRNAELPYAQKHPALLPRNSRFTSLLINYYHRVYLHPGVQTLQYLLLQSYWILSSKRAIRSVVKNCQKCFRAKPHTYEPFMGELPKLRISQLRAFSVVGVDYAGPFTTTLGKTRGAKTYKSYVCIFVCFSTKATHLELVSELSCDAFLCAFRRFISRRGRCSKLYSDCGTNFTAAYKYFCKLLRHATDAEAIEWHFNPPAAPHFSGLAEAGVKSVKTHLRRVIADHILTFEEFYTVLVQIEALLNSRPLCAVSADPNDLSVLTPGHFLTLEPISVLPDADVSHIPLNRLSRWQLLLRLHQHFWGRWRNEYLHTLQQRQKWLNKLPAPEIGALVLIKNDNTPPASWLLGRIIDLCPGDDGVVRVAVVKTQDGTYKRPVVKLCPLPMSHEDC